MRLRDPHLFPTRERTRGASTALRWSRTDSGWVRGCHWLCSGGEVAAAAPVLGNSMAEKENAGGRCGPGATLAVVVLALCAAVALRQQPNTPPPSPREEKRFKPSKVQNDGFGAPVCVCGPIWPIPGALESWRPRRGWWYQPQRPAMPSGWSKNGQRGAKTAQNSHKTGPLRAAVSHRTSSSQDR